jgi:hypothetical protein
LFSGDFVAAINVEKEPFGHTASMAHLRSPTPLYMCRYVRISQVASVQPLSWLAVSASPCGVLCLTILSVSESAAARVGDR